jgi:excisionase family DNA binding protein
MSEVMTVSEAARALDKSAQTVREWADVGKLPSVRTVVGQRIFKRVDVERIRVTLLANGEKDR